MPKAAQLKDFEPEAERPQFIPFDLKQLQGAATSNAIATLDATNKYRHNTNPAWDRALKLGQQGILDDVQGDKIGPQLQAELVRGGMEDAYGAFGDTAATLTPGSAGAASVGRNLGIGINNYNQQLRANRYRALQVGSQVYPDTQIGLSGGDAAAIGAANTGGLNSWNEADYHDKIENERLNWRVQAENLRSQVQQSNTDAAAGEAKSAANKQALIQGGAAIAGIAVLAIGL